MTINIKITALLLVAVYKEVTAMEYLPIGQYKIPVLGLGTFLANDKIQLTKALNEALKLGYRHIDTASLYNNEDIIGEVLKDWISSGKIKREELFITTKLGPTDTFPENVENALKTSLEKLKLDYVDLYLIHSAVAWNIFELKLFNRSTDHVGVWKKMEEQVDAGRTRTIGLSNFNQSQIEKIQNIARIQPANLQIEAHVYFQQRTLREYARKNNILFTAYAPLGNPGIANFAVQKKSSLSPLNILADGKIKSIAKKHKKTPAQVAIRFLIQSGMATIPKSTNPKRLRENIDVFNFVLDEEDLKTMESLDKGKEGRIYKHADLLPELADHPEYPFHDV